MTDLIWSCPDPAIRPSVWIALGSSLGSISQLRIMAILKFSCRKHCWDCCVRNPISLGTCLWYRLSTSAGFRCLCCIFKGWQQGSYFFFNIQPLWRCSWRLCLIYNLSVTRKVTWGTADLSSWLDGILPHTCCIVTQWPPCQVGGRRNSPFFPLKLS